MLETVHAKLHDKVSLSGSHPPVRYHPLGTLSSMASVRLGCRREPPELEVGATRSPVASVHLGFRPAHGILPTGGAMISVPQGRTWENLIPVSNLLPATADHTLPQRLQAVYVSAVARSMKKLSSQYEIRK